MTNISECHSNQSQIFHPLLGHQLPSALNEITIAIAATFTVEPIKDSIIFWMQELDIPSQIEFAPYNQIFQQLLAPKGLLADNLQGVNVILVRFEDWIRVNKNLQPTVNPPEKERILANQPRYILPNRLEITHLNRYETEYLYQEIFVEQVYLKHGIVLHDSDCIFDVGANIGLFTLFVQQKCPQGTIYAFEPAPHAFEKLQSNAKLYCQNAHLFNCGLGGQNKEETFTFYPRSSVFSSFAADTAQDEKAIRSVIINMLRRDHSLDEESLLALADQFLKDRLERETYQAKLRTLSEIIEEYKIEKIDLLKLDAEKSELAILQGIKDNHWSLIKQIVVEVHDQEGNTIKQVIRLLEEKGFEFTVDEETLLHGSGLFNIYATRPNQKSNSVSQPKRQRIAQLEQNVNDFGSALKAATTRGTNPHLVCICPPSPTSDSDNNILHERMQGLLEADLVGVSGVYLIKSTELTSTYPVEDYYDPYGDELGHIPYTPAFFCALGTMLARKISALKSPPYKVIALDCDQTLWSGVCGEDGATGVRIDPSYQALQKFIIAQQEAGKLICLCSKNQHEDVFAVFDNHPDMLMGRHHLVNWRINWQAKSENLKLLADELQLGLDSFIFIDDNPVECAEVRANCPEVLTLQLPEDPARIPQFLEHIWAFDQLKVTTEDQQRTELYQQNVQRQHLQQDSLTFSDFLAQLGLEIEISQMQPEQLSRVAQLTVRTNQFNMTTRRRSEAEIQQLCESGKLECRLVKVKDRFGDYGLVGLLLFETQDDALSVDTFLLSCRVLGRGVEHRMLAHLGTIAQERGLSRVDVPYIPTKKNQPSGDFLESIGGEFQQEKDGGWLFQFRSQTASELTFTISDRDTSHTVQVNEVNSGSVSAMQNISKVELFEHIANNLYSPEFILKEITYRQQRHRPELDTVFVSPRTPVEVAIAHLFTEVLKLESVGLDDNFFELGGDSIRGAILINKLQAQLGETIHFVVLFDTKTVAGLAAYIEENYSPAISKILGNENTQALSSNGTIARVSRENLAEKFQIPLSFAQARMWFLAQLEPESPFYNAFRAVRLSGRLDVTALERSLNEIIRRHEVLRTTFTTVEGLPVQAIAPKETLHLSVVDLQEFSAQEQSARLQEIATTEQIQPFDFTKGSLLRVTRVQLGSESHVLLLTMHHIITDGWSIAIFIKELSSLYQAFVVDSPSPLPELPIQYADFTIWQRQWMQGEVLQSQLNYWKQQLTGVPPLLELSTDRPRPPMQTFRGRSFAFQIDSQLTKKLKVLSHKSGTTLFMTMLAAFATLLFRYSGQEDILVGTPTANRNHQDLEPLMGFFVNTLVMRTRLDRNPRFCDLLKQVRHVAMDAYANQDVPFEQVVEALQLERNLSHSPLFQVIFALQNAPAEKWDLPGLVSTPMQVEDVTAKFDLALQLWEVETSQGTALQGLWEYSSDLFDGDRMTRMVDHFQTLLAAVVTDPQQSVGTLPLLTERERHQLLLEWNDTYTPYPDTKCIHQLFEEQVEQRPDAVAVVYEDESLTYQQLNERANQLAPYLQTLGVGPEVLVGICIERSPMMIVALLAILKAGGAYVPFDPAYPQERLAFMLQDAKASVLLTQQPKKGQLPLFGQVICLDTDWSAICQHQENLKCNTTGEIQKNKFPAVCWWVTTTTRDLSLTAGNLFRVSATADNLAYVIYTSGSTGQPKGVMVPHRAVMRLVLNTDYVNLQPKDVIAQVSNISFDAATFEIWGALLNGAKMVILNRETVLSPREFANSLRTEGITTLFLTTALFNQMVQSEPKAFQSLRFLLFGGEAVDPHRVRQVLESGVPQQLLHVYGPTENTTFSTWYRVEQVEQGAETIPIGRPIGNTQVYILDPNLQPVPIGVWGELYAGGAGLARGYWNRPELNEQRFIPKPFGHSDAERLYKTGDLVRYLPDGNIEFFGRIDNQVKIRGFRIELSEIEAVLSQHPLVRDAVVIAREDKPGVKSLAAYVIPELKHPTSHEIRLFLKEKLPDYMVPASFTVLEVLPITPNGKVDRRALPVPKFEFDESTGFISPSTHTQFILARIWRDVLVLKQVGIHDNFFELGGDSIIGIQIIARANQAGLKLTPKQLFQHQTIAELAAVAGIINNVQYEQGLVTGYAPLTPIQHWFFEQNLPEPHHFNQSFLLEVPPNLKPELLKQALQKLLCHHDALRLRFVQQDEQWQQQNGDEYDIVPLAIADLSDIPQAEQLKAIEKTADEQQGRLNLADGPLMGVVLFHLGNSNPGRLLIVIHHLVVDGISWRVLLEDLSQAYKQLESGKIIQLPAKTTSFKDWAIRLQDYGHLQELHSELDYWLDSMRFAIAPLPLDYPGVAQDNTVASSQVVSVNLSVEQTRALLQDVPGAYNTQINDVLLTALVQTFARWTGSHSLLIDLEGHGREHLFEDVDLSRTVGWFTSIFPVLLKLEGQDHPGEVLKSVKEQLRRIPNRGIGYGILRYLSPNAIAREKLPTLPQAKVSFNYLGQFDQTQLATQGLKFALESSSGSIHSPKGQRRHLLNVSGLVVEGRLKLEWQYGKHFYQQATVENLAHEYVKALEAIIAHCLSPEAGGYTPSDFPGVEFSQEALDELLAEIE